MGINKKLVPIKGHFFFQSAGLAPVSPFLATMAKDLGISAFIVGGIFTIIPVISIVIKPLLGGIADKFRCQRPMFLALLLIEMAFMFATNWIPPLPSPGVQLLCEPLEGPLIKFCSVHLTEGKSNDMYPDTTLCKVYCLTNATAGINITENFDIMFRGPDIQKVDNCIKAKIHDSPFQCTNNIYNCKANCNESSLNKLSNDPSVSDDQIYGYYQFWILVWVTLIWKVANNVVVSVGDAICFNVLEDKPSDFGRQRLWASMGWGGMAALTGLIVDKISEGRGNKDYSLAFYISFLCFAIDFFISLKLKYKTAASRPTNIVKDLVKALAKWEVVIFLIWCIANGILSAPIFNFFFWFLEEVAINNGYNMVWIKTLEGFSLTVNCYVGEIPFFFFSGWLINKIGHKNAMTLVLTAFGIRFIYYSYLTNPWWTLPAEVLHGITYGVFYSTLATYATSIAPLGAETAVQNFVSSLFDCVGLSIGSFLGGYLIQRIGSSLTFWYLGLFAMTLAIMHALIVIIMGDSKTNYTEKNEKLTCGHEKKEHEVPLEPNYD